MITEGDPSTALVHVVGLITNKNRHDGKMVGAAAAVIPMAWHETSHHDQAYKLREGVSQYNIDTFGISLAGRAILSYLEAEGTACHFTILSRSQSAISSIANLNSPSIQEHALNFAHVYNHILSTHADVSIAVEWTPADTRLPGFCQATCRAQQECTQPTYKEVENVPISPTNPPKAHGFLAFPELIPNPTDGIGMTSHALEKRPIREEAEPELLRFEVSREIQVYRSKHHKAFQGKGCHHSAEDLKAGIVPAFTNKGELYAGRQCRAEEGRRVINHSVDIGHRPHKDLYVTRVATDEHTLQRFIVLGSMSVSRDMRKKFLHVDTVYKKTSCFEAEREAEISKCPAQFLVPGATSVGCDHPAKNSA
ncbi:hypothetical protein V8E53_009967 [Lactarius tabidus]